MAGMMGLCVKAGQATFGTDGCLNEIRKGSCGLLLISSDASDGTKDKLTSACSTYETRYIEVPEGLIQTSTGRPGIAMAVKPGGFSDRLWELATGQAVDKKKNKVDTKKHGNKFGGVNV